MTSDDLAFASATEIRDLIARRQLSSVEITELFFTRIESLDSQLNSYLTLVHDQAVATAREADKAVARGDDDLGPLHGVPISIKDLQMTAGIRTTGGSFAYRDRVPEADSTVAERVRGAGAIILGKTNTPEFGLLGTTENRLGDPCRNPWNTERTPGGSSGGAGAALAAGLCSLATGGDGGGSIRIPASLSGVYGIKPTQGRVSSYSGVDAPYLVNYLSQQGPMSRNVKDSAVLLQVLAGHDPRDPGSLRDESPDFVAALDQDIRGLRIGWSTDYGYTDVDGEVVEVTAGAARVFEDLGCSLDDASLELDSPYELWRILFSVGAFASQGHLLDDPADPLTDYARRTIEYGATLSGADVARALGQRNIMLAQFADVFENFDLLLSPTMPRPAPTVNDTSRAGGGGEAEQQPAPSSIPFTHPINTIGYTAASVPCGFSSDGLPIGLHIVGRPGDEATVIAASAAFERARPWADKRPPVS